MIYETAQVKKCTRPQTQEEYYQINLSNKTKLKNEDVIIIKNDDFKRICSNIKELKILRKDNKDLEDKIVSLLEENKTLLEQIDNDFVE